MRKALVAAMLAVACVTSACAPPELREVTLSPSPDGNFVLYVSNQRFDCPTVDVTVEIDGMVAVSDFFEVGNQHTWIGHRFQLREGEHTIRMLSDLGGIERQDRFTVGDGPLWAVSDFRYKAGGFEGWRLRDGSAPAFGFRCYDRPIGFL